MLSSRNNQYNPYNPYRGGTGMGYRGGYGGGGMSRTTVVGAIAVVLILALGGTTVYLLTTRNSDENGDCSSVQSQLDAANAEIETLRGQLDSIASGGGGGGGGGGGVEKFVKQKTGFFGAPMWIFLVIGGVIAVGLIARFAPLKTVAQAIGNGVTSGIRTVIGPPAQTSNSPAGADTLVAPLTLEPTLEDGLDQRLSAVREEGAARLSLARVRALGASSQGYKG